MSVSVSESWLYGMLFSCFIDFIFFTLIDNVVKSLLRVSRNLEKKRTIWLYESSALLFVSLIIWILDHSPYTLWILTTVTFFNALCSGRIDFYYWWNFLKLRLDEYLQHKESLERLTNGSQPLTYAAASCSTQDHHVTQTCRLMDRRNEWKNMSRIHPTFFEDCTVSSQPLQSVVCHNSAHQNFVNVKNSVERTITKSPRVPLWSTNVLTRRPLRSNEDVRDTLQYYASNVPIKDTLMASVLGGASMAPNPPGLRNDRQNLCFMNSIIQCLARTPDLVERLASVKVDQIHCSLSEFNFISQFIKIMTNCTSEPNAVKKSVLETKQLQHAVSVLNYHLISGSKDQQSQQDASEFLMWLLTTCHEILNYKNIDKETSNPFKWKKRFSTSKLSSLKSIYGDMNTDRIQQLIVTCKDEIKKANGLEKESYVELLQRLSDLEWLIYKQENDSIVDDLFTGQLLEVTHGLTHNQLSAQTQTFSVLPVPIAKPRDSSDFVFLEDCFTAFCSAEHDTRQNFFSYKNMVTSASSPSGSYMKHISGANCIQSPFRATSGISPINGDNFDYSLSNIGIRTSTPVVGRTSGLDDFEKWRAQDTQRMYLLRQLPDCIVIQLLRYKFSPKTKLIKKIKAPVNVTLKNLDLKNIVYDTITNRTDMTAVNESYKYNLYAVAVHLDAQGTSFGHYISYCLDNDGLWYKFDDACVSKVNMQYELTTEQLRENAYILFYKRASG